MLPRLLCCGYRAKRLKRLLRTARHMMQRPVRCQEKY